MPRPAGGQGNRDRCQKWYTDYSTEMVLERKKIKIKIMVAKEMIGDTCNYRHKRYADSSIQCSMSPEEDILFQY